MKETYHSDRRLILEAWVNHYQASTPDVILDRCEAARVMLRRKMIRLAKMRYHTTVEGFKRLDLVRAHGVAIGVHMEIAAVIRRRGDLTGLHPSGILEGGGGVLNRDAKQCLATLQYRMI